MAKKAKARTKPKAKKLVILPMVMSKLVAIALKDLRKVEKMKTKYAVDMDDWYQPNAELTCVVGDSTISKTKICSVCAAGSVMAFSLGADGKKRYMEPASFPANMKQLHAINNLRTGQALVAYSSLFPDANMYDWDNTPETRKLNKLCTDIPPYEPMDPEPFHAAMKKFQAKLEKAGY